MSRYQLKVCSQICRDILLGKHASAKSCSHIKTQGPDFPVNTFWLKPPNTAANPRNIVRNAALRIRLNKTGVSWAAYHVSQIYHLLVVWCVDSMGEFFTYVVMGKIDQCRFRVRFVQVTG